MTKPKDVNCKIGAYSYWQGYVQLSTGAKKIYGKNYGDWLKKRDAALKDDALGIVSSDTRVSDAFKEWQENFVRPRVSDATYINYESFYRRYLLTDPLARYKVSQVGTLDIQAFFERKKQEGVSLASLTNARAKLTSFFRYMADEGYIRKNPVTRASLEAYSRKKRIEVFSDGEVRKLLEAAQDSPLRFAIYLALGTGIRSGELRALCHSDIEDGILHITKTATRARTEQGKAVSAVGKKPKTNAGIRDIPLSESVLAEYHRHKAKCLAELLKRGRGDLAHAQGQENLIFTNKRQQNMLYPVVLNRELASLCDKAGIPRRSFHAFRHTFITKLLEQGEPIAVVKELAGHSNISQTIAYTHVEDFAKKNTVAKIESLFQ